MANFTGTTALTRSTLTAGTAVLCAKTAADKNEVPVPDLLSFHVLDRWDATTDPGVGDDSADGYAVGSRWRNTATGVLFVCHSAAAGAAVWHPVPPPGHPGFVSGNWYDLSQANFSIPALAADVLYGYPLYLPQPMTVTDMAVYVGTGAASSAVKLGLYATSAGLPGAKVVDAGSVATETNATQASVTLASPVSLSAGVYWGAAVSNGTPAVTSALTAFSGPDAAFLIGHPTLSLVANAGTGRVRGGVLGTATYAGGLPASFGAVTRPAANTASGPILYLKAG